MNTGSKLLDYSRSHLFGIELAFIELKNYQSVIENFLDEEKIKLKPTFNESDIIQKAQANLEIRQEYYSYLLDQCAERAWELNELYPHNFRASFLTQIISFVEYELKKICDHHHHIKKSNFGISDLKGNSDFEKAQKYLSKVAGVNFLNLEPEWEFINKSRIIRNKIIHQQGVLLKIEKDFKQLDDFVNKQVGLKYKQKKETVGSETITEFTLIISSKDFSINLLRSTEIFFKKLLEQELKYMS